MREILRGRPRHSWAAAASIALILVVFASAGAWLGRKLDSDRPLSPAPPGTRTLARGGVSVTLPAGWTPARGQTLPGIRADAVAAAEDATFGTRVLLGMLPFSSPTLMPAPLVEGLGSLPSPRNLRLAAGFRGYLYAGLVHPSTRGPLDVVVTPTTAGVATVVCISGQKASALPDCGMIARSLVVTRARPVALSATSAFAARLPAEVAALSRAREREREAVGRADPAAILRLGAAYDRVATRLRALAPARAPAGPVQLTRALHAQGGAYERLARALQRGDGATAGGIRAEIATRDTALRGELERDWSP